MEVIIEALIYCAKRKGLLEELRYELTFERNTNKPDDMMRVGATRSVNNMLKMPSERERKKERMPGAER